MHIKGVMKHLRKFEMKILLNKVPICLKSYSKKLLLHPQ